MSIWNRRLAIRELSIPWGFPARISAVAVPKTTLVDFSRHAGAREPCLSFSGGSFFGGST